MLSSNLYEEELAVLADALAHPARVRLVRSLISGGPATAGALHKKVPLAQATVSQHLSKLREAGVVTSTRRGREVVYQVSPQGVRRLATLVSGLAASLPASVVALPASGRS